jgi:glycogen debranching enzyme
MFSGWGIRTYASGQPGYNPIGYHTGTVWPHDTSLIAAGMKRYGFDDAANRLVGPILEAAQRFPEYRLPELFCGFDRDHTPVPVPYPVACSPQAWAAGSTFLFLETMLGLRPHADRGELELRPDLPVDGQGHADEPPCRRGVGGPPVPPLAWDDERRGAAQGRRRRCHDPALMVASRP